MSKNYSSNTDIEVQFNYHTIPFLSFSRAKRGRLLHLKEPKATLGNRMTSISRFRFFSPPFSSFSFFFQSKRVFSCLLETVAPPYVQVFPDVIDTEEGKTTYARCKIVSFPPPHLVTWSRSQGSLPSHFLYKEYLFLRYVTKQDSGSYVCTATNTWGTDSSSVQLRVHAPLKFTIKPPPLVIVKAYEVLILPCSASSFLTPRMFWTYSKTWSLPSGASVDSSNNLTLTSANFNHVGVYTCTAYNAVRVIRARVTVYVKYPDTCARVKTDISEVSGYYIIDPDGVLGEDPFLVYCNMSDQGGVGVTVISHDSEERIHVTGYDARGSYSRDIHYRYSNLSQIKRLINVSGNCHQFIKYECYGATLRLGYMSWWVSRNGQTMRYWGGASQGCACGVTNSCARTDKPCNCDKNDFVWREDSGFLTIKSDLPVIQLRFGDTGDANEEGYHTLGKLECY